ncbi:rRNA methyltransferase [Nonomuraea sp. K274]|uniref:rRNA methyltransferase n=1 Tax=Nonomuraea cypriaca TaxID=1187855 RepID=A0A931EY89_9ACTN|nr:TrmH family RNA methyltransferase [Nonomuraea cypriaca]MBF8188524.1 rRNA methyltransferase [Nonomuraea cypriaca]
MALQRITSRNATFQQLQALLTNRSKRHKSMEFLVQGVRPINLAVQSGWRISDFIYDPQRPLSRWAEDLINDGRTDRVAMSAELLAELSEKNESIPEIIAVVSIPRTELADIKVTSGFLGLLMDRPSSPGNIGSAIRSADAFGAGCVIVSGHAADIYDPKCVRATTGSLFTLPVVRAPSHHEVSSWLDDQRAVGHDVQLVGTDERGSVDIFDFDLTRPTLLLIGNETVGLSAAWRELCDDMVRIPITGAASSLNAANAATTALYEATRQRSQASK